jgi:hypothetical protein
MDDCDIVESIARGMAERFGAEAAHLAREQAENAPLVSDVKIWRDIADAIDRLSVKPSAPS